MARRFRYPCPPASQITPEALFRARRRFLRQAAVIAGGAAVSRVAGVPLIGAAGADWRERIAEAERGPFATGEPKTEYRAITTYNNFFEFGTRKTDPYQRARRMETDPWSVTVAGECERPGEVSLEKLLAPHAFEERIYRLRCVEAWSMVIPWIGIPLGEVLKRFEPTSRAKYVAFETLYDPEVMPGQQRDIIDWPYREGLRVDEAMHPLTILAVGLYEEVLPEQCGAPLRLVVPWKYGYKSIKSIVGIRFQEDRPVSSWQQMAPEEYGFYANVNPEHDHPRWSQATERRIGERGRRETELLNGYAEEVGHLYDEAELKRLA